MNTYQKIIGYPKLRALHFYRNKAVSLTRLAFVNRKLQLNITEVFASIQGETPCSGLPTTFIRLAACNLRCRWCDTPYSFTRGTPWTLSKLLERTDEYGHNHVCITGGEPLLQSGVHPLMTALCDRGYTVQIETGGSLSIKTIDSRVSVILDIKCPGSGMEQRNLWENLDLLKNRDAVKFVLSDRTDYDYAVAACRRHHLFKQPTEVLFSPVFDELPAAQLVEWILEEKLPVRLNLQIHKFVWSPTRRGV